MNKCKKNKYEQLALQLKTLKLLKEQEMTMLEEVHNPSKPIYTDDDIDFLKHAINNGELSIASLTFEEAMLLDFPGEDYRRVCRKACSEVNFSSKAKRKEFKEKLSKMNSPTPQIVTALYNQIQKKK